MATDANQGYDRLSGIRPLTLRGAIEAIPAPCRVRINMLWLFFGSGETRGNVPRSTGRSRFRTSRFATSKGYLRTGMGIPVQELIDGNNALGGVEWAG